MANIKGSTVDVFWNCASAAIELSFSDNKAAFSDNSAACLLAIANSWPV